MIQIKVCGLTRRTDVELCLELGVDRLGFVLAPSPRQVEVEQLAALLPPAAFWSAVLVDPAPQQVEQLLDLGCPCLQFHGQESPEFCARYQGRARIVKALRLVRPEQLTLDYPVDEYLLDGPSPGQGLAFDWGWLRDSRPNRPFFVAGGLKPENVRQAIVAASPLGVDVSSGVELSPGVKDAMALRRFVAEVRPADPPACPAWPAG